MRPAAGAARETADEEHAASVVAFARALADDIELLAGLHDRELDEAVVTRLQEQELGDQLGIVLGGERSRQALQAMHRAVADLPRPIEQAALDELAVGYADVYLRHHYRASPTESVWLTEDGLERQAPMFEVRDIYLHHGLRVTDWANRPDDHIVLELRFLSSVLGRARDSADLAAPARFLDAHVLRWIGRFAERLVAAEAPDFYAALALLTAVYLDEIRNHLTEITGIARPDPATAPAPAGKPSVDAAAERPYLPGGLTPSW